MVMETEAMGIVEDVDKILSPCSSLVCSPTGNAKQRDAVMDVAMLMTRVLLHKNSIIYVLCN